MQWKHIGLTALFCLTSAVAQAQTREYAVVFVGEEPVRVTLADAQNVTVESKTTSFDKPRGRLALTQRHGRLVSQLDWQPEALVTLRDGYGQQLTFVGDSVQIQREDPILPGQPILFVVTDGPEGTVRTPAYIWPLASKTQD